MHVRTGSLRRLAGPRDGERGVVLILTLLTLLITVAMVTQLTVGSSVAWNATRYRADRIRMEHATRSAAQDVLQLLIDDVAGEGASGLGQALGASGMGPSGAMPGGDAIPGLQGDAGADGGEDGGGGEESPSDSRMDTWAKPMRVRIGNIEIVSFVEDENGKFNVHRIVEGSDENQELERARMARIVDKMRDGFDGDLGESDGRRIVEDLVGYMDRRRRDRDLPLPERHSLGDEDRWVLLGSLEEMLLLESVTEELFYDQVISDERIAPGLQSVLTCYVLPAFEEDSAAGEGIEGAPAAGAADAGGDFPSDSGAQTGGEGESVGEGGLQGVLEGEPPIGNLINLNTAPRAVLEGMFPGWELEPSKVEEIIRWRNEVDEEAADQRAQETPDPEAQELQDALFGRDEEDPLQFFSSLEEIAEVDGFGVEDLTPEIQAELEAQFGVQSDVFSVYLWARVVRDESWEAERYYQEAPGQALRLRALVWRVTTQDGVKAVFLRPWHEVPYTRWRIPDFQRELPPFRAQRFR